MLKEARDPQKALVTIIRSWRPDLLNGGFGATPASMANATSEWTRPGWDQA